MAAPEAATLAYPAATVEPPFGTYALPPLVERLRQTGGRLGTGALARRAASAIRRVCLAGRDGPFDVSPFPGQNLRLNPRDNLCEKRVFAAPQFWDAAERAMLAQAMHESEAPFHFVDAGANVGLYTLALRAEGPLKALAIEPDPENLRRLHINLAASGAAEVAVAPVALSSKPGRASLAPSANRGETAVAPGTDIPTLPLLDLIHQAGLTRIDALKIDIEGAEAPVLAAFLRDAPRALHPKRVVIEAQRGARPAALDLLTRAGYLIIHRTRLNAILTAPERGPTL
ncbi:MAG: FkbM family methyltransferase [Pseudomonadota bacterium]